MISNETRTTKHGIEMRIMVNGEYQWRLCEMEPERFFPSRASSVLIPRPRLHKGEMLMETLDGEAQIVMGLA